MNDFLVHIGWLTLSMSSIILLVLLWSKIFGGRFSAKSRYTVWAVVVLSLCIGTLLFKLPELFTFELEIPSFTEEATDLPEELPTSDEIQQPITNTPSTVTPTTPVESNPSHNTNTNLSPGIVQPNEKQEIVIPTEPGISEVEPSQIDVTAIIFAIWIVGAILYFTLSFTVYIRSTHKYTRAKKVCNKDTIALYKTMCRRYKIKRVPNIFVCSEVGSPILYGYTNPTILIPEIDLSDNSLVGVLAHELTHYRRGDIWIKLICLLTESLYWFNPLVHLATSRCNAEMELSCDETVLAGMDEDVRRSYGNVMLEIVEHCSRKRSLLTTQFNPQKNAVKERIMNILDMTKKNRGRVIITVALILCVIAGTVIGCTVKDNNNKIKESVYTIEAGVISVDSLAFENVDTDVITELVISKDVESIDFAYINSFPALTKVTVDAENAHYRGYENQYGAYFLMSLRSNEIFYIPSTEDNSVYLRNDDALAEQYNANENISLYTCGGVLNVFYTQDEYETYWYLRSLSYDGLTKEIGYDKQISGNCSFDCFRIDGGFVATHANYTWSNTFIFKDGAWIEHNPNDGNHGSYGIVSGGDGISFYPGENGELLYNRITESMVAMQTYDWFLSLTSADQFWKEDGVVTISGNELVFTPTKTYTVTDYFANRNTTIEDEFERLKDMGVITEYASLEEMFAANANPGELTQFLNKTFTEIEAEGYTLEHLQGNNGWAGWPNYSISGYEGVTLTFRVSYGEETREHLTNVIPDGVEIMNPGITINGLRVSMSGEEAKSIVSSWDGVYSSLEHGGRNYVTTYNNSNGYEITAYWAMPEETYTELESSIPPEADENAFNVAKEKLIMSFTDNPAGEILCLRIRKAPTIEQSTSSENQNTGFTLQTYMHELVAYLHEPFELGEAQYPDSILGLVFEYCFYNKDALEGVTVNEETFGVAIDGEVFRIVAKSLFGDDFTVSGRDLVGGRYDEANDTYTTSYSKDYWGGDRYTIEWESDIIIEEKDSKVIVTATVGVDDEVYGTYVPFRKLEYTFTKVKAAGCYHYRLEKITETKESAQTNSDPTTQDQTSTYIQVDTISALPKDPSEAWRVYDPMMSPIYYFFEKGLTYYCRYEYHGEHYEKNTLILPDGYTNGEIFYVRGTGGSASMYIIVKTDQGYLRYYSAVSHGPDEILSVNLLTDDELEYEKSCMANDQMWVTPDSN